MREKHELVHLDLLQGVRVHGASGEMHGHATAARGGQAILVVDALHMGLLE